MHSLRALPPGGAEAVAHTPWRIRTLCLALGSQRPHSCRETGHLEAMPTGLGLRQGVLPPHVLKSQQLFTVHTHVVMTPTRGDRFRVTQQEV